ncbi:hypothetical protein QL285_093813 [Trifolium repens]|nr:hypothetical protein QL285_093813 [Trifolium repens]
MKLLAQEVKKFKKKLKEAKNGQKGARSSYHDDSHRITMGYACWPRQYKFYFGNKSVHRATMTSIAAQWHFLVIKLMKRTGSVIILNRIFLSQHDRPIAARWISAAHYKNYK